MARTLEPRLNAPYVHLASINNQYRMLLIVRVASGKSIKIRTGYPSQPGGSSQREYIFDVVNDNILGTSPTFTSDGIVYAAYYNDFPTNQGILQVLVKVDDATSTPNPLKTIVLIDSVEANPIAVPNEKNVAYYVPYFYLTKPNPNLPSGDYFPYSLVVLRSASEFVSDSYVPALSTIAQDVISTILVNPVNPTQNDPMIVKVPPVINANTFKDLGGNWMTVSKVEIPNSNPVQSLGKTIIRNKNADDKPRRNKKIKP